MPPADRIPTNDGPREAGRDLDRAVAEEVCGWVWVEMIEDGGDMWLLPRSSLSRGSLVRDTMRLAGPDSRRATNWDFSVPKFSTDLAAAWTVVERITDVTSGLVHPTTGFPAGTHFAHWFDGARLWASSSEEAAEAICRAALAAAGHERAEGA